MIFRLHLNEYFLVHKTLKYGLLMNYKVVAFELAFQSNLNHHNLIFKLNVMLKILKHA